MRTDADRLNDILSAIAKIRERATGSLDAFECDEMLQVWVIHHPQLIGEAARGISQGANDRQPEVQRLQIVALRNILVHEYFGLNLHQVWMMAQKDIPELESRFNASGLTSNPIQSGEGESEPPTMWKSPTPDLRLKPASAARLHFYVVHPLISPGIVRR